MSRIQTIASKARPWHFAAAVGIITSAAIFNHYAQAPAKKPTPDLQAALEAKANVMRSAMAPQDTASAPKADRAVLPLLAASVPPADAVIQITNNPVQEAAAPAIMPEKIPLPVASPMRRAIPFIKNGKTVKTAYGEIQLPAMFVPPEISPTMVMAYGEIYNATRQVFKANANERFYSVLMLAKKESNFNLGAVGDGSTAGGLFQITNGEWLRLVHLYGEKHGYGHWAHAIRKTLRGSYYIADQSMAREIMAGRNHAKESSIFATERVREICEDIAKTYPNRVISGGDIYAHYFLGKGGGPKFLATLHSNPNAVGAQVFPDAAAPRGNWEIFAKKSGHKRTIGEMHAMWDNHFKPVENLIAVASNNPDVWPEAPAHLVPPAVSNKPAPITYAKPDLSVRNIFYNESGDLRSPADAISEAAKVFKAGETASPPAQDPSFIGPPAPVFKPG